MSKLTEQRFLADVAKHQITVLRDDGLDRHVRFRQPDTYCMGFDIVTWPGYLCYCGDMGTYVFTRTADMFGFFRDSGHDWRDGRTIHINPSYWSEKCVSADRDGVMEYSADLFRQAIEYRLEGEDVSPALRQAINDEVLSRADDGEHAAMQAAIDFQREGFMFLDFWEARVRDYTPRFMWCCYALAWGIQQYDKAKAGAEVVA